MKKLLLIISAVTLLTAETSVFEKDSIESKKQYGFTETEQYIYNNKKNIDTLQIRLNSLAGNIEAQGDSQGGMQSIVITNSKKISKHEKDLSLNIATIQNLTEYIEKLEQTIQNMDSKISQLVADNQQLKSDLNTTLNYELQKRSSITQVKKISRDLLDEINSNKKEIKKLKKLLEIKKPTAVFKDQKPEKILQDVKNFMAKRDYDSARTRLSYLANNTDFSQARVLYFLGEVEYQTADYEKAAKAFKASGSLDTKANYMPTLLYHAAISYQRIKDNENARIFFQTLIDTYPKSSFIKGAKKRLKNLK